MSLPCNHCGSSTLWDDSISSAVCTECGSLADPSQSVLTSSSFVNPNDTSEPSLWDSAAPITLKGFRRGNNWDLVGQGKEARDRKNMVRYLSQFLVSLTLRLVSPA
jgi:transcription factor IIIB subunit 2